MAEQLIRRWSAALLPGGRWLLSFRDYSHPLEDTQRFIPVRADDQRIHTCVLEYFPETVRVTDLLHERGSDGNWVQKTSSYNKLRIDPENVKHWLVDSGLQLLHAEIIRGMCWLVAGK